MLKNLTQLEHAISGKIFRFSCDIDAELPMVKEALCQFMKFVGNIEDQMKTQSATVNPETSPVVPPQEIKPEQPKAE